MKEGENVRNYKHIKINCKLNKLVKSEIEKRENDKEATEERKKARKKTETTSEKKLQIARKTWK